MNRGRYRKRERKCKDGRYSFCIGDKIWYSSNKKIKGTKKLDFLHKNAVLVENLDESKK